MKPIQKAMRTKKGAHDIRIFIPDCASKHSSSIVRRSSTKQPATTEQARQECVNLPIHLFPLKLGNGVQEARRGSQVVTNMCCITPRNPDPRCDHEKTKDDAAGQPDGSKNDVDIHVEQTLHCNDEKQSPGERREPQR